MWERGVILGVEDYPSMGYDRSVIVKVGNEEVAIPEVFFEGVEPKRSYLVEFRPVKKVNPPGRYDYRGRLGINREEDPFIIIDEAPKVRREAGKEIENSVIGETMGIPDGLSLKGVSLGIPFTWGTVIEVRHVY